MQGCVALSHATALLRPPAAGNACPRAQHSRALFPPSPFAGANVPGVKAIGHVDANGGGILNGYGLAFYLNGKSSTTWAAICNQDSDLDGQTNGFEASAREGGARWILAGGR